MPQDDQYNVTAAQETAATYHAPSNTTEHNFEDDVEKFKRIHDGL